MKKFKYKRKCPKCKQHNISNTFVKKGSIYKDIRDGRGLRAPRDLMYRKCWVCNWTWEEKVK